jgi:hypothetical protein
VSDPLFCRAIGTAATGFELDAVGTPARTPDVWAELVSAPLICDTATSGPPTDLDGVLGITTVGCDTCVVRVAADGDGGSRIAGGASGEAASDPTISGDA